MEKEACAVVKLVKKFQNYVLGVNFVIETDHKPLLGIIGEHVSIPELNSLRLVKWALVLSNYRYKLVYKPKECTENADALSRLPSHEEIANSEGEIIITDVLMIDGMSEKPINTQKLAKLTREDKTLGRGANTLRIILYT